MWLGVSINHHCFIILRNIRSFDFQQPKWMKSLGGTSKICCTRRHLALSNSPIVHPLGDPFQTACLGTATVGGLCDHIGSVQFFFGIFGALLIFLLGGNDGHFKATCFLGFLVLWFSRVFCGLGEWSMSCCNVAGRQPPTIGFSWMLLLLGVEPCGSRMCFCWVFVCW